MRCWALNWANLALAGRDEANLVASSVDESSTLASKAGDRLSTFGCFDVAPHAKITLKHDEVIERVKYHEEIIASLMIADEFGELFRLKIGRFLY